MICSIFKFSDIFAILPSTFTKGFNASTVAPNAIEPNNTGSERNPIAAIPRPSIIIELATRVICFISKLFVAFAILPSAVPNIIREVDISIIVNEPNATRDATAGTPNPIITPANIRVIATITPTCLNFTSFVASTIFLSAIPNRIRDVLITSKTREPINAFFLALFNILNVRLQIFTIPNIKTAPNNAGIPVTAIVARNKEVNAMRPVNIISFRAAFADLLISLLFLDNFSETFIIESNIKSNKMAPNIAGIPVTAAMVKNIDVINKLPTRAVILFATFVAAFISFLFFIRLLIIGVISSTISDNLFAPLPAKIPVTAAMVKNIDVINKLPTRAVIFFAALVPSLISLLFFASLFEIGRISLTISSKNLVPNNANIPVAAPMVKSIDDINKLPTRTVIFFAALVPFSIFLLFFASLFVVGKILFIILDNCLAPHTAGIPVIAAIVNNNDVVNKFPTRELIFFAALVPASIFLLFLSSLLTKGINSSTIDFTLLIPADDDFTDTDATDNFIIDVFSDNMRFSIFFAIFAPALMSFLFFISLLARYTTLSTIIFKSSEPIIAGTTAIAPIDKNIDDTNKFPARDLIFFDTLVPSLIFFLFLISVSAIEEILSTILFKSVAPNVAVIALEAPMANNNDVTNKFPARDLIFFDTLVPSLISFLFFVSFVAKGINFSKTSSILLIPLDADSAHIDAKSNDNIALFKCDVMSIIFFDTLFALSNIFPFSCNSCDIDSKESLPTSISLNFLIILFLIIKFILQLTFDNAFIISGAALTILMRLLSSFLLIFKSSFASLNIAINFLILKFPEMISFKEISLSLLNASTREDNPPPLFCSSMFFIIASATFSEALSLNFTTRAFDPFPCCIIAFSRPIIAFLMPLVSSRISRMCLLFIFIELLSTSTGFFDSTVVTSSCRRFLTSSTILCILFSEL